jgi:hypothetical protein
VSWTTLFILTGRRLESFSMEVWRGPSSVSNTVSGSSTSGVTATISSLKAPLAIAASALALESSAKASCVSRAIPANKDSRHLRTAARRRRHLESRYWVAVGADR